jgi:hypothetical protein
MNGLNQVARFGYQHDERVAEHAAHRLLLAQLDDVKRQALEAPVVAHRLARQGLARQGLARLETKRPRWLGQFRLVNLAGTREDSRPEVASNLETLGSEQDWDAAVESIELSTQRQSEIVKHPRYNVALVAAAFDRQWILSGNCLGDAYDLADRLLLVNNCQDKALKYFGFIKRGSFPTALGKVGPNCWQRLSDLGAKIKQIDVSREVGTEHKIDLYFSSPSVIARLHEEILHVE